MKRTKNLSIVAAAALLAFTGAAFSQTVINGNFSGPDESTSGVANIAGWNATGTISTRTVQSMNDQMGAGSVSIAAPAGGTLDSTVVQAWFLSANQDSISQTISGLTIGDQYTVSFDEAVANRSADVFNGSVDWSVSLGSQTLASNGIAIPGAFGASAWIGNSLTFTANATSEVLAFLAQSSVGVAPEPILLLDNVSISNASVAAVPEPGTYALMLAGLGAVGFIAKRRKSA
jgi:PEP-CTERM motif